MTNSKEQFLAHMQSSLTKRMQDDIRKYVSGRTRCALSACITVCLSACSLRTPYPMVIAPVLLILWMVYILSNANTRFFVTSIGSVKNKMAESVNDLFYRTELDLRYSNQKSDFIGKKALNDLKVFNDYGSLDYQYHNAIKGTIGGINIDIYNFDVLHSRAEQQTTNLFSGSLYVMPLHVPKSYYLSIMPEEYRRKARVTVGGHDVSRLFRSREQKENLLGITPGFAVHTNNEDITLRIIDETVAPLFKPVIPEERLNVIHPLNIVSKNALAELAATQDIGDNHLMELLIISDQKAYLFFPFRHKRDYRDYPFDLLQRKHIKPDSLWHDVQDMLEKEPLLKTIQHNAKI